jgi:NarL family two-component system response regulator LiaR
MDLLPNFRGAPKAFRTAASWMLSSDIPQIVGFASAHRLMLLGFYNMVLSKQRLAFMVTTEQEALRGLATSGAGLLIVTQQLERGSGLSLVERAHSEGKGIRSLLILDGLQDNLVAAGRSAADAVFLETDCFSDDQPLVAMFRSLALGQPYRSPSVRAALEAASLKRDFGSAGPPDLNRRELELVALLAQGLGDRVIAERLAISYETARSRGKALRRKLGVRTRAQVVAKVLRLGLNG